MTEKLFLITGLCLFLSVVSFSQPVQNKYSFSVSSGLAFEEKKPVVYFNLNYYPAKEFYVGLKGGCYTYSESMDDAATRIIADIFKSVSPGSYSIYPFFTKQNPTYIAALNGGYKAGEKVIFNFSLGVKYYTDFYCDAYNITFKKISNADPPPNIKITSQNSPYLYKKKDIVHGYISAGIDYKINSYSIGIFADNIFSAGINIGKEF